LIEATDPNGSGLQPYVNTAFTSPSARSARFAEFDEAFHAPGSQVHTPIPCSLDGMWTKHIDRHLQATKQPGIVEPADFQNHRGQSRPPHGYMRAAFGH
jgi:hypothetical protein